MSEPLNLFVIEDDDHIALLIRRKLERASHHVKRCRTAAEAMNILHQSPFDLVLLDQQLPDMTGLELLKCLSEAAILIPVLVVTARGDEQVATRALQAGAQDYVVKDSHLEFLEELPRRVEEAIHRHRLEQVNRLLAQSMEAARDGILITDLQGVIVEVNPALEAQTGYNRGELLGQTPRLFKSGKHESEFYRQMWQTILNRQSWQGELTNRRKDGALRDNSMTISPVLDRQGRMTHFVCIQRDITEHKKLQQQYLQTQKMQSLGKIASGIAHEFNNLLTGINGYASLGMREPEVPPVLREFFANIVQLSDRAANFTRQFLTYARMPALIRRPTRIAEVLRTTLDLVRHSIREGLTYEEPPPDEPPLWVDADANQLQQALINLAMNSCEALRVRSPGTFADVVNFEGGGEALLLDRHNAGSALLMFRLDRENLSTPRAAFPQAVPPGDYAVITVADQGCGMTSDELSRCVEEFFTTKEEGRGTGLGLPTVKEIVEGHHGFLTLQSKSGVGTIAQIYLPRL